MMYMRNSIRLILPGLVALSAIMLAAGCSDRVVDTSPKYGIAFSAKLASTEMAHLIDSGAVTITPDAMDTIITGTLTVDGQYLIGEIPGVPVGGVFVEVQAFNATGDTIYAGNTPATIRADRDNPIHVNLYPVVPFIKLSPWAVACKVGLSFSVDARIFRVDSVRSISFRVFFDGAYLQASGASLHTDLANPDNEIALYGDIVDSTPLSYYWISIMDTLGSAAAPVIVDTGGNANLATISFTARAEGITSLTILPTAIYKFDGTQLDLDSANILTDYCRVEIGTSVEEDMTRPAQVTDLRADSTTQTSVYLSWTAPGDDDVVGTAHHYDIRYSTSVITDANWGSAATCMDAPSPQVAGTSQWLVVTGLNPGTTYYFAIKAADEMFNLSALSNVAMGTTL